jgi:hypothetical protein
MCQEILFAKGKKMSRFILLGQQIVNVDQIATIGKSTREKYDPEEWIEVKFSGGFSTMYRTTIDTILFKILHATSFDDKTQARQMDDQTYIQKFLTSEN